VKIRRRSLGLRHGDMADALGAPVLLALHVAPVLGAERIRERPPEQCVVVDCVQPHRIAWRPHFRSLFPRVFSIQTACATVGPRL
jgi:hypothetical protein